jgi:hypothetical protein
VCASYSPGGAVVGVRVVVGAIVLLTPVSVKGTLYFMCYGLCTFDMPLVITLAPH